ncbi:efflux RND transporter periplasmic adaptor subunit [Marinovum sp. 2_MG-2023]|uniref:efflux RND transporter periplasmic adaptor subunit n=1 Tax=unclassified Marinovum TaxID=2647166 RepID=UPI0026E3A18A|nr:MULTISPECIES: efflux RND transporter periplasmic adaptor subunit [unclassified Marinovum]MDO6731309.1 efflux RND transporter periplasmic adaptor subunit [Marinovum sp. 2_MG-2023]MDO6780539.1 efflux RND transporter periplasmic adaptor subunit [Marinovum sp. 1_MG-2023]
MGKIASLLGAIVILAAAYAVTFGVPAPLAAMIGPEPANEAEAASAPPARAGGGRGPGGRRGGATTVAVTELEFQPYESILSAIGTASALRSVDVLSETSGTVIAANLAANRLVNAGDVLVQFDARTQTLNLEIAEAELQQATETVARYERLRQNGNSTITDVTLSEARVAQRLAEAAVGLAEVALDKQTVRAPISGTLGLSDIEVGDTLSVNGFVASIDQSNKLVIEFEMPERAIGLLAKAKQISAGTSTFAGKVFTGEIMSFDSRIDSVTRSVTVKAQIDNSDGLLWPGMTFAVRLTQLSAPLAKVPSTAITWSREGSSIWINAGGAAQQVPVTILFRQDDSVWVDADLSEGAMVVTEGAQKLRNGAQIAVAGAAPGAGPAAGSGAGAGGARPGERSRPANANGVPAVQLDREPQTATQAPS